MSKHTPGPWMVATSCSYRRIVSHSMTPVCVPTIQRTDGHPDLYFPNGGEDGPDARLIAASPTLLEEMLRYLPIIERAEADPDLWERLTFRTGIATANGYHAAIAKATGEA